MYCILNLLIKFLIYFFDCEKILKVDDKFLMIEMIILLQNICKNSKR